MKREDIKEQSMFNFFFRLKKQPRIIHFCHHKYLTLYYDNIMNSLSYEYDFAYKNFYGDRESFLKALSGDRDRETIYIQYDFKILSNWNFNRKNIIEQKYENIIGNEIECFERVFKHYEFSPERIKRGLELVEEYSLKNYQNSNEKHIRNGSLNQWKYVFTPLQKQIFKQLNGKILISLGYEENLEW